MRFRVFLLVVCALVCAQSLRAQAPILVVNSGGHEDTVRAVVFSSDGKHLYSAGEDKVIRVWDVASGRTTKTIRGEIKPGQEGKINTLVLSPDNRFLAVAGILSNGNRTSVRVHDLRDRGEVFALLDGGAPAGVAHLAFSPNGRLLACGSADRNVRLFDFAKGGEPRVFQGHQDIVQSVAFSPDGSRLLSSSLDRTLRLWEISSGQSTVLSGHQGVVVSAVFSPDGRYIVSSSEDRQLRLWDGKTGKFLKVLATQGTGAGNLSFSSDGRRLLTSSSPDGVSTFVAQIYSVPDGKLERTYSRHDAPVMATAMSRDGKIAATAGGLRNEIHLWNSSSGERFRVLVGNGRPVLKVGFAEDGESIAFGTSPQTGLQKVFYLRDGQQYRPVFGGDLPKALGQFTTEITSLGDLQLRLTDAGPDQPSAVLEITKAGARTASILRDRGSGYRHSAYTFTGDGRHVITGGFGGVLSLFRASDGAKLRDFTGHTGDIQSIAVSKDHRTFVSGSTDQTLRIWDIQTKDPLLSIFVGADDQWIAWTPEGYYTTNGAGDRYVGWHINRGPGKTAAFFTASQYLAEFYKPQIVANYLRTRNIGEAVKVARETRVNTAAIVTEKMGPLVAIKSPASESETPITGNSVQLVATAQSETAPITSVKVLVNKALVVDRKIANPTKTARFEEQIKLESGKVNRIEVVFSNGKEGFDWCDIRTEGPQPPPEKPNLYVLAIGLSKYKDAGLSLEFADKDATVVTDRLKKQEGLLFKKVHSRVLIDAVATKDNILEGLGWLREEGTPYDLRFIFISGHGALSNDRYVFWCYPYDKTSKVPEVLNITSDDIMSMVMQMRGRVVLMVDTCHSSAIVGAGIRGSRPDISVVPVFKRQDIAGTSVFTFASSGRTEKSLEHREWGHGAFTRALLDAFDGKVADLGRLIRTVELGRWLEQRVPELTKKTQNARTISIPAGSDGFEIFYLQ